MNHECVQGSLAKAQVKICCKLTMVRYAVQISGTTGGPGIEALVTHRKRRRMSKHASNQCC